jgi:hypothetical protein
MPESLEPSNLYYALTPGRLGIIAHALWDARVLAATTAIWDAGANRFSIGLHAWLYGRTSLTRLATNGAHEWLSVADEGAHFIIKIGGCPLRFCSGDDESTLRESYRDPKPRERADLQLAFTSSELMSDEIFFRFLMEADAEGMPIASYLAVCDLNTGEIVRAWRIDPSEEGGTGMVTFVAPKPPIILPGLRVETHAEVALREQDEEASRKRNNERTNNQGA